MARPSGWDVVGYGSDPVPGEVWEVKALAGKYSKIGEAAEDARVRLQSVKGSGWLTAWDADSGDVFIAKIESLPSDLEKCADSYLALGSTLSTWADDIDDAQYVADKALAAAKDAHADEVAAQASLGGAQATYNSYNSQVVAAEKLRDKYPEGEGAPAGTRVPTDYQYNALKNNRLVAQNQVNALSADISDASSRVEAAKKLVVEAHGDWTERESATVTAIGNSADAGLGEQSFWDKVFGSEVWETIITVCKIVVAIGGIIVLIIGGPLAWLVLAAALLVLADTLYKMSKGQADGWDLAFALLDCIPGGKGITSIAHLGAAAAGAVGTGAKLLAMGGAFVSDLKGVIKMTGSLLQNVFRGGLLGQLDHMTAVVVHGTAGALGGLTSTIRSGGSLADIAQATRTGFTSGFDNFVSGLTDPVRQANMWQGNLSSGYVGVDAWQPGAVPLSGGGGAAPTFSTGFSGTGPFSVPEASMIPGGSAATHYEGVQVGLSSNPNFPNLRPDGITWQANVDLPYATSNAVANPQFGGGGTPQIFVPDFNTHVLSGNISILDNAGNPIPTNLVSSAPGGFVINAPNGTFAMDPSTLVPAGNIPFSDVYGQNAVQTIATLPGVIGGLTTVPWDFSEASQHVTR